MVTGIGGERKSADRAAGDGDGDGRGGRRSGAEGAVSGGASLCSLYADFGDFATWRIKPAGGLLVAGFGKAARLKAIDLAPDADAAAAILAAEAGDPVALQPGPRRRVGRDRRVARGLEDGYRGCGRL